MARRAQEARTHITMAVKPQFRSKFPLLITGSLLALQPFTSLSVQAAEQFDCKPSATGGWACSTQQSSNVVPPRPQHSATAVSSPAQGSKAVAGKPAKKLDGAAAKGSSLAKAAAQSGNYAYLDWVPRDQLTASQLAEVGPYCKGSYVEPQRAGLDSDTPMDEAPMFASSKASRYEQDQQVATLAGDVVLRQGTMQVEADEARLLQLENRGELIGKVKLRDQGMLVVGDKATLQLDNGEAEVENAEYVVHEGHVRGSALYAKRDEDGIIRLKDGTYTRCEPGENTWHLKGNNVRLDPATGFGSATNVTLRVKDIPVFYTPYIYFPIDDRRQSGFLPPSLGSSSDNGFTLVTPYYFNLAPNYDATLYPRYMAKRGLQLEGEGRYLTRSSEGQIGASWLSDSEDERKKQSDYSKDRWMYSWQHKTGLDSRLLAEVDYTDISDPYYFQDLETELGINTPNYIDQRGSLTWRGDHYTAQLNAHAYEMATVVDVTPYNRMPQLSIQGALPYQPMGLRFTGAAEAVRFERSLRKGNFTDVDGNVSARPDTRITGLDRADGNRFHTEPGVSLPMDWSYGFFKPSLKYLATSYDLDLDQQGKNTLRAGENFKSSQSRGLPMLSLDGGLYFDRNSTWFGNNYRQTLEPRLFYLYVPHEDQEDIPNFDSSEPTFNYSSLFRENRFNGRDRIGDANQLSLGVTNRWIESNGFERQRFSVGQIMYFRDREVQMPGVNFKDVQASQANVSPYALDYLYRFNRDWRVSSDFNWDPDSGSTRSGSLMFHYQPEKEVNKIVNLGYRYRNDTVIYDSTSGSWRTGGDYTDPVTGKVIKDYYKVEQHDASVIWPIVPQWSAIARWQYDYNRSRTLEAYGGFEYDSCCWKLRLINRYWVDYDEFSLSPALNEEGDRGIFLQIVLKGLGGVVGSKVESFLDQGIQGYREREEQAF